MMRLAGYSVTDLMDLQLGLTELNEIGFSQKDLYELGLTEDMSKPWSIYALLLDGLQSVEQHGGNDEDIEGYYL